MSTIAVITTFPDSSWDIYAKKMLKSFVKFWPATIPLCVQLDTDLLTEEVNRYLRPQDGLAVGWDKDHAEFVGRNKGKDDPLDYRKQPVRFCHKVFAIKRAFDAAMKQKAQDPKTTPRYLVWMDADVITNRLLAMEEIKLCLPKEGDAVAYLGRKEWPHSECGWLAFDLENGGDSVIKEMASAYRKDIVMDMQQQDDSWCFDQICALKAFKRTDLSPDAKGLEAWAASPMTAWSTHYKGPEAKSKMALQREVITAPKGQNFQIHTKNAIPHEDIRRNIAANQELITNWIRPCHPHYEEIVIVSAGPMMIPEDVKEYCKGTNKKIVAVKHALEPLKKAGVKVWASILLDPRPHVADFVKAPDSSIIWFVASQVDPDVTQQLIDAGCTIWGYHANVGAGEASLTNKQSYAVISGGSATATRGMFVLSHMGFKKFALFGYDLCFPDKQDMGQKDEFGQARFMEMTVGFNDGNLGGKRCFWTEPQLVAQFEELNEIIKSGQFEITAYGDGIIPFVVKSKKLAEMRNKQNILKATGGKTQTYEELLWGYSRNWPKWLPRLRRANS